MYRNNIKTMQKLQNIQFGLIIILVLTLPYFIAPAFGLLLSVLIFLLTIILNGIDVKTFFKEKTILFLFIFITLTYVSALWSPASNIFGGNFEVNINAYLNYFFLIPGIYFSNLSKEKIKLIFTLIILSPVIYVVLYFTNYLDITHIYSYHYDRVNGNYSLYVDLFANIFLLASSIFLYIKLLKNIIVRNYQKALIIFIPFSIVSLSLFIDETTVSRLINLSFLVSISFVSLYMSPRRLKLLITFIISILSILVILSSDSYNRGITEVQETYQLDKYQGSWGHRIKLAMYGIDMWLENPYFGRGTVDVVEKMREIKKKHPHDFEDPTVHFHNQHILILVQTGIVGYMAFLLFIYNLYRLKIKNIEIDLYKRATIVIFLTVMIGEHYLQMVHTSTFFATLIGLFLLYKNQEMKLTH
jgi:O-antigen ligase